MSTCKHLWTLCLFMALVMSGCRPIQPLLLPVGHAVAGSLCGLYLTDQFWTNPLAQPDASCIDAMPVVWSTR